FPERNFYALSFQIPARNLNRSLRHSIAAHGLHQREDSGRTLDNMPQHHRRKIGLQSAPRALGPLLAIERSFARSAFAPALCAVRIQDAHEHNAPLDGAPKAGLEEMNQGQTYLAQFNLCDYHKPAKNIPDIMPATLSLDNARRNT